MALRINDDYRSFGAFAEACPSHAIVVAARYCHIDPLRYTEYVVAEDEAQCRWAFPLDCSDDHPAYHGSHEPLLLKPQVLQT